MRYTTTGAIPGPLGARHPSITPFEAFDTADGSMIVAAGNDALWHKLCQALGRPELASDERFATNDQRTRNGKALTAILAAIFKTRPLAAWTDLLEQSGVPCGPINNIAQALAHPQVAARNMLVELEDAQAGKVRVSGNPLKLSGFADPVIRDSAPGLDANRAAILQELGFS
jgi:CoA:oxalate CoA-transferase